MKPVNHHGSNPAIAHLRGKQQRAILKREAQLRSSGNWGTWTLVDDDTCRLVMRGNTGWVRNIRAAHRNDVFSVLERLDSCGVIHVAVASMSGIRPTWYEMQRIKDELFGAELTAVEIYPAHRDIVDGSDMFHIWILPGDISFGLTKIDATRGSTTPAGELLLIGKSK